MSDPNPYEPPSTPSESSGSGGMDRRKKWLVVLLSILMFPSAAIAGFTTCITALMVSNSPGPNEMRILFGLCLGLFAVFVVIGLFVFGIRRVLTPKAITTPPAETPSSADEKT